MLSLPVTKPILVRFTNAVCPHVDAPTVEIDIDGVPLSEDILSEGLAKFWALHDGQPQFIELICSYHFCDVRTSESLTHPMRLVVSKPEEQNDGEWAVEHVPDMFQLLLKQAKSLWN